MRKNGVVAIIGAQHGSEGKGVVASRLARGMAWGGAVRVGGPNAGHSFYHDGKLYKMRSVPCAWVNPGAQLIIGAGAVVNAALLCEELSSLPPYVEVAIDRRATLITEEQEHAEAGIKDSIGSTGEGVGYARIAKIKRDGSAVLAGDYSWKKHPGGGRVEVVDDASVLIEMTMRRGPVMLEGTQGSALSLHHGSYPFVTSTDTNVSGIAAEAGIAPSDVQHTFLVARTFPIRVGGNSGPMSNEIGWDGFIEQGIVQQPERTTVTKKIRRIQQWDPGLWVDAVRLNKPCGVFFMFGDYIDPSLSGKTDWECIESSGPMCTFMDAALDAAYVPVVGVGTGGPEWQIAMNTRGGGLGRNKTPAKCLHGDEWVIE